MKRLLIFHPAVMPYRQDFFNQLAEEYEVRLVLTDTVGGCRTRVWKELKSFRPDVVLTGEFGMIPLRVLMHRRLTGSHYRIVTLCDDSLPFVQGVGNFSRAHIRGRNRLSPRLDEIILSDSRVAAWFQERYQKGVWMPILSRCPLSRTALKESNEAIRTYGLAGKRVFLYAGRFVSLKNIPLLLEAYARIRDVDTALVLVGDGAQRAELEQKAKELGLSNDVIWDGWQEGVGVAKWYNIATALVLPSRVEPFGAVVGEALDGGCRVLVSDQAGAACLIDPEKNGAVFSLEGDAAETLAGLMNNERAVCPASIDQPRPSLAVYTYDDGFDRIRKVLNA